MARFSVANEAAKRGQDSLFPGIGTLSIKNQFALFIEKCHFSLFRDLLLIKIMPFSS